MTPRSRAIVIRSLFFSGFLFAGFGAASLAGLLMVEETSRNILGICFLMVAAADVLIAFALLTRS